jgi:hypothetical protein
MYGSLYLILLFNSLRDFTCIALIAWQMLSMGMEANIAQKSSTTHISASTSDTHTRTYIWKSVCVARNWTLTPVYIKSVPWTSLDCTKFRLSWTSQAANVVSPILKIIKPNSLFKLHRTAHEYMQLPMN